MARKDITHLIETTETGIAELHTLQAQCVQDSIKASSYKRVLKVIGWVLAIATIVTSAAISEQILAPFSPETQNTIQLWAPWINSIAAVLLSVVAIFGDSLSQRERAIGLAVLGENIKMYSENVKGDLYHLAEEDDTRDNYDAYKEFDEKFDTKRAMLSEQAMKLGVKI